MPAAVLGYLELRRIGALVEENERRTEAKLQGEFQVFQERRSTQ
ncbi:hypothetical protein AB0E82_14945 [Streptomyces anulatus]